jgi:hypothetical protein
MADKYSWSTGYKSDIDEEHFSMSMKIKWNYTNSEIIERKGFGKELNKSMAEIIANKTEPYVPWGPNHIKRSGHILSHEGGQLSRSRRVYANKTGGTIVWTAQYAEAQYTGPNTWNRYRKVHPLATSQWNEVAWMNHEDEIMRKVTAIRREMSRP